MRESTDLKLSNTTYLRNNGGSKGEVKHCIPVELKTHLRGITPVSIHFHYLTPAWEPAPCLDENSYPVSLVQLDEC